MALVWLFPIAWVAFTAFRPIGDTIVNGYVSLPQTLTLDNFISAWNDADLPHFFLNTLIIVVPALILILWISSMLGFVFSRFSFKLNILLLIMFTAGNLLPPQIIIVPLLRLYLIIPVPPPLSDNGLLYNQYVGITLIHVIFQTGFCTFVLSNYMKTISKELTEAALVDGASVWMIYRKVILPLCRPALAALATLEFTFMYNDFFWALFLMKDGDRAADHVGPQQPAGRLLHRPEPAGRGLAAGGHPDDRGLPGAVEAVRPRADAGLDEGLVRARARARRRAASDQAVRRPRGRTARPGSRPTRRPRSDRRRATARPASARRRRAGRRWPAMSTSPSSAGQPVTR